MVKKANPNDGGGDPTEDQPENEPISPVEAEPAKTSSVPESGGNATSADLEKLDRVRGLMSEHNCTFEEALAILMTENGSSPFAAAVEEAIAEPPPPARLTPEAVATYEAVTGDYHDAVLLAARDLGFMMTTPMKEMFCEWIERLAEYESRDRKVEVTPSRMIEILIREAWATDPSKGGTIMSSATGERDAFNPSAGGWTG